MGKTMISSTTIGNREWKTELGDKSLIKTLK
jgi:hypothetical protein